MADQPIEGIRACVFDAYGTLFDFNAAAASCADALGDKAAALSALWREKQLQYTWLRSLMGSHKEFWEVTGNALDYALDSLGLEDDALRRQLFARRVANGSGGEEVVGFVRMLQVPNVFCAPDLSGDECLHGAATLHTLSRDPAMRARPWGRVWINRHNTLIQSDYDAALKFDLPAEQAKTVFMNKPTRAEVADTVTRSEELEKKVKNNSAGLRAVCDLNGLRSALCVQGFETFVAFLKAHRDYRVAPPWDNLMFVDGTQLDRVNFALNSSSRDTYLYVNVASGVEELTRFLDRFKKQ